MELTKKEYHILMNGLAYYIAFRKHEKNEPISDEEIADLSRRLMNEMLEKFSKKN